ncbi:IS3 family transposase [uncultured Veillonella sp.]|uniref:IS3 family transposase n=1 Tax=uncultured Veillonella sp. TaxID=159268 RepID=UPI00338D5C4C
MILGVSRSGYYSWVHRRTSKSVIHREKIKEKIRKIYNNSHQNYSTPKIAKELRKAGEVISERTVDTTKY